MEFFIDSQLQFLLRIDLSITFLEPFINLSRTSLEPYDKPLRSCGLGLRPITRRQFCQAPDEKVYKPTQKFDIRHIYNIMMNLDETHKDSYG